MNKILNIVYEKQLIKRYGLLMVALFVSAISYNLLIYPAKIVAGGTNGLSIIVEYLFHLPPSIFILLANALILIISLFTLGIEKSSGSIISTFVYPLFVDMTSGITSILSIENDDMILIYL